MVSMKCAKQFSLLAFATDSAPKSSSQKSFGREGRSFGGSLLKNSHAKSKRPLDSKQPTHLVLRSSQATGKKSFLYSGREVQSIILRHARKQGVRIKQIANGGNHLHLIVQTPRQRALYAAFVRGLTGELARFVTGARKGAARIRDRIANSKKARFWDQKPFTRILSSWGKEYGELKNYLRINNCETLLGLSRKGARQMLDEIRALVQSGQLRATGFS